MNISTLWLADSTRIDWEAGERALAAFKCPADGFPEDSPLSGSFLEDVILEAYAKENATTDAQRKNHVDALTRPAFELVRESVENGSSEVAEIRHGGWRVFASGGLTHSDPATDFADAIDTLDGTGILEAAGFNPSHQEIEVVTHSHKHGVDLSAHRPGTAEARLVAIARESWTDINHRSDVPDEPPEDDLEAVQIYIDCQPAGSYLGSELLPIGA
ncbi:MAG: hypothetical protein J0H98_07195 [Solirubrobacterales bacterium]|nr:hypothetical protein [Solirubrobacterales bacterium]